VLNQPFFESISGRASPGNKDLPDKERLPDKESHLNIELLPGKIETANAFSS
jgi:hypothetical protein